MIIIMYVYFPVTCNRSIASNIMSRLKICPEKQEMRFITEKVLPTIYSDHQVCKIIALYTYAR